MINLHIELDFDSENYRSLCEFLDAKNIRHCIQVPVLKQHYVSLSADIEEPKVIVYNAETERIAKEQWTNCRKIDAVKTIMKMGYSLKDAKTYCERHFS